MRKLGLKIPLLIRVTQHPMKVGPETAKNHVPLVEFCLISRVLKGLVLIPFMGPSGYSHDVPHDSTFREGEVIPRWGSKLKALQHPPKSPAPPF